MIISRSIHTAENASISFFLWRGNAPLDCAAFLITLYTPYSYLFRQLERKWVSVTHPSPTLLPHGPQSTRLLCPWNFPGKNTGVGGHSLLQGILSTQGLNLGLLHCGGFFTGSATREAQRKHHLEAFPTKESYHENTREKQPDYWVWGFQSQGPNMKWKTLEKYETR